MHHRFRSTGFVGGLSVMCLVASFLGVPDVQAAAQKPAQLVKKTMDGRCLEKKHPDFWKTKIYVAKPTLAACVASGGRKV